MCRYVCVGVCVMYVMWVWVLCMCVLCVPNVCTCTHMCVNVTQILCVRSHLCQMVVLAT